MTKVCGADLIDASMEYKQKIDARGSHVTATLRVSLALYGVSRGVVDSGCGEAIATEYLSSMHLKLTARLIKPMNQISANCQSYAIASVSLAIV